MPLELAAFFRTTLPLDLRALDELDDGRYHSIWMPDHLVSFWPDTISSDIHRFNINGPVFDLVTTMSKFLFLVNKEQLGMLQKLLCFLPQMKLDLSLVFFCLLTVA